MISKIKIKDLLKIAFLSMLSRRYVDTYVDKNGCCVALFCDIRRIKLVGSGTESL